MLTLMFSVNAVTSAISVVRAVFLIGQAWSPSTVIIEVEIGTALIAANLAVLTPYIYRLLKPEGDFDSEPCTYYRSVQPDGGIRLRRVADIAPELRSVHAPQPATGNPEHAASSSSTLTREDKDDSDELTSEVHH
ncbi:hypothetical protein GYMLUDRAFT_243585 [Collybiopsis luxurians FD-317 M1]|uniref:Uncharacterized protein n=1 Tax=Collybiopsis luxurians FD-317 M1 TaxID=944289 RepID=A0A0D0CFP8_9AGAR|nr:hypothetical protein GYMLUDRAFT_243585 [Collybiopsis luxurians FD-317 M1]